MAVAGTIPEAWMETAHVELCLAGTGAVASERMQYAALTETIDIDEGEKQTEGVPNLAGGRVNKITPQGDTTVTLEMYPIGVGAHDVITVTDPGVQQLFDAPITDDVTYPLVTKTTRNRSNLQLFIMWTSDTAAVKASAGAAVSNYALRFQMINVNIVSVKKSMTDGITKYTVMLKAPPFNKAGTANWQWESTDGTIVLVDHSTTDYASPGVLL